MKYDMKMTEIVTCMLCANPLIERTTIIWIQDLTSDCPNKLQPGYYCHLKCITEPHASKIHDLQPIELTKPSHSSTSISSPSSPAQPVSSSSSDLELESYPVQHHTDPSRPPILVPYV